MPHNEETAVNPHAEGEVGGITVLVVDDEPTVLKLAKLTLEAVGFQVYGALDGTEAIELLGEDFLEIRVALIDYEVPGTKFEELLREIRSHPSHIQCVVTSGYSLQAVEDGAGRLPSGVEFLKKPFSSRELIEVIQRASGVASHRASHSATTL